MTAVKSGKGKTRKFGPWNPGLESEIPDRLLPLSTMFRPENVMTGFGEAQELADFSGMQPRETVAFRPERLIIHELLVRVTADLSVPDGPEYEELGINLRGMTAKIYQQHVLPRIDELISTHERLKDLAREFIEKELDALDRRPGSGSANPAVKQGFLKRILKTKRKADTSGFSVERQAETAYQAALARWNMLDDPFEAACGRALRAVTSAVIGRRGSLPFDKSVVVDLAMNLFNNDWCSEQLGSELDPIIEQAAKAEGYRFLPPQTEPVVMNVKGASAAGKSTIRPYQRSLAKKLGVPWEDFALVSPDYWRKYLLNYESLGPDYKYGAMLTGHELEIVDNKLDRYMAEKADRGTMPHLLIDRFRFDSFKIGEDGSRGSNLLTRFGHTVFMFFMVTPPEATVERAWKRGLTTGRFKAVDDLLDHNIEAYAGMPALFFAWAFSDKKVHFEFLDNSISLGQRPRTIACGWNGRMIIFDIDGMLNIDRFRKVNIRATKPGEVLQECTQSDFQNLEFIRQCCTSLDNVQFFDRKTGKPYAIVDRGHWIWMKKDASALVKRTANILEMAGLTLADHDGKRTSADLVERQDADSALDCLIGVIR